MWDIGAAAVIPNFGLDDIVELGIGAQIGLAFDLSGPWSGRFDVSYLRFSPHDTNMGIVDYTIFPAQLGMDRSLGAGDTAPLLGLRLGAYLLERREGASRGRCVGCCCRWTIFELWRLHRNRDEQAHLPLFCTEGAMYRAIAKWSTILGFWSDLHDRRSAVQSVLMKGRKVRNIKFDAIANTYRA